MVNKVLIIIILNKNGVKCGTWLRFWENNGWIDSIDPYGWFYPIGILDICKAGDCM